MRAIGGHDASVRSTSAGSFLAESVAEEPNTMTGPIVPFQLQRGTMVNKLSKKSRAKKVCLVYSPDFSRLNWDPKRPDKNVHLDEILAVRSGSDVQQYALDLKLQDPSNLFVIIYSSMKKSDTKIMHLQTETAQICQVWVDFLEAMLRHRQELMTSLMAFKDDAVAQYWQSEMTRQFGDQPRSPGQEELDIAGVTRVCQSLHIYSSQSTLEAAFYQSDVRRRERLSFPEFLDFVRRLNTRPEVKRIIRSFAAQPELGLTMEEFFTFLRDEQGEDVDAQREQWEKEFSQLIRQTRSGSEECFDYVESQMMSEAAFTGYLTSTHNGPLVGERPNEPLDRPINEYIISSSHNTYLLGRQIAGNSSVEGYISALVRRCRCVEIDCWDGPNGQPKVTHGRTMTTDVSFREVLLVIKKYAFVKTLYPLWISLEVRCSAKQQSVMPIILREIFGSKLIEEPLESNAETLPSPEQLKEHILVKVKKPKDLPDANGRRRGNSLTSPLVRPSMPESNTVSPSQSLPQSPMLAPSHSSRRLASKNRVNTITEGRVTDLLSGENSDNESGSEAGASEPDNSTVKALGQLGVYCAGVKFNGFDSAEAKEFNHIFSFQESTLIKNTRTKEMKMALDLHNMRYLMRIYPDATRIGSSNFDPLMYWRRGVQMAALNWQSNDVAMQINRAMFDGANDSSGYVLKPESLRNIQVLPFNTEIAGGKKARSVVSFSIHVQSAQQLMRPAKLGGKEMHPYVEVEVFDGRANYIRDLREEFMYQRPNANRQQTDIVKGNGFNPFFKKEPMRFEFITKYPEFVFVKFTVKLSPDGETYNSNSKDIYGIASWTVKLQNLKQGYRTLPLENEEGVQYLFSTLFAKIQIDPVYTVMTDAPRRQEVNKLKSLGGKVFGRVGGSSPRSTIEKSNSSEKRSFDSSQ